MLHIRCCGDSGVSWFVLALVVLVSSGSLNAVKQGVLMRQRSTLARVVAFEVQACHVCA